MISSTAFRIALDQENKEATLASGKGIAKSTRKPLGDRTINQTPSHKPLKSQPLKGMNIHMPNVQKKSKTPEPQIKNTYPEWFSDVCSFKEVEDDYDDICLKSDRLNPKELLDFMLHPETPPFTDINKFFPPQLQVAPKKFYNYFDDDEFIPEIPIIDVELPEFSF